MRVLILLVGLMVAFQVSAAKVVLVVHGGAGAIPRAEMTEEKEAAIRAALEQALRDGAAVLAEGGSSLDAVSRAVVVLEDAPHFNAGKGAVFTAEGRNELDAAIMDGATLRAGSVAGLTRIRNPILLARAVMEQSPHVMMVGAGAEAFARSIGMDFVDPKYFHTDERWQQLERRRREEAQKPRAALPARAYFGTVGAVARDRQGRLAAATSTGGMTMKRWGRVGDAPIIGAGTYANDRCAVSATGWGEYFIRATVAHDICARVIYRGDTLAAAADEVVRKVVPRLGGDGGVIALDADGNAALPFNTEGMYRGTIDADGKVDIAIYRE
jgi:beta-aspartyl-peptidase (threonine type)